MSKRNGNIAEERRKLIRKADEYYQEFESAREDLEKSSKKLGQNILIIATVGFGLAATYKLLFPEESSEKKESEIIYKSSASGNSRLGSALKSIAVPFLIGIAKNIILPTDRNVRDQE